VVVIMIFQKVKIKFLESSSFQLVVGFIAGVCMYEVYTRLFV